jgi:hypothetical protein
MLLSLPASTACRLLHFSVVDEAGELQHLDRLELLKKPISLTGGCGFLLLSLFGLAAAAAAAEAAACISCTCLLVR